MRREWAASPDHCRGTPASGRAPGDRRLRPSDERGGTAPLNGDRRNGPSACPVSSAGNWCYHADGPE